jgi:GTP-binding protein HflX
MRSLVLHPDIPGRDLKRSPANALDEAIALARALDGVEVAAARIVRLVKPHSGLLFGTGKVEELRQQIEAEDVGLVIIDAPVTPVQQRNLERAWKAKVWDRTGLILEIFGARARTREGVLQVDLAALAYQRSRLVRSWTHLERQRGGLGFIGGAGETQIEADRRAIDEAMVRLKRQLTKVVKTRSLHRAARKKVPYPIVALVGYTNAGKSTIFNALTGAEVLAKDMLFATLDPTMRGVRLPSGREIILSDTVGFISDLPTQLVAAFRATLEEVLDADLVLHVRDITHPESAEQAADVVEILTDLGVDTNDHAHVVEVWNKIDRAEPDHRAALLAAAERDPNVVATSAVDGAGLDRLATMIEAHLAEPTRTEKLRLAFSDGRRRAWLFDQNVVDAERQTKSGYDLTVTWSDKQANQFRSL